MCPRFTSTMVLLPIRENSNPDAQYNSACFSSSLHRHLHRHPMLPQEYPAAYSLVDKFREPRLPRGSKTGPSPNVNLTHTRIMGPATPDTCNPLTVRSDGWTEPGCLPRGVALFFRSFSSFRARPG